jgi:hypothetical protein
LNRETPPTPAPEQKPSWSQRLRDPALLSVAVYALLAMAMATCAYFYIFVNFAAYDDEGTLLVSLQAFAHGETLYRDAYSPYGPFFYEVFGGFFAATGWAVTNDASRTIVIVFWVVSSLLYGFAVQRLTRNLALGVAGCVAAFACMFVLANEPMHPQVLCVFLLGAITLLAVSGPGRDPRRLGATVGVLAAGLVLTKLNLGVYAVAAAVLAAALIWEPLQRRSWTRWGLAGLVVVMPVVVAVRDLGDPLVRNLVAVEVLSLAAIAAVGLHARRGDGDEDLGRWLIGAAVGFAAAFVAIMAAILITGPSLSDVDDGVVTEAMRVREVNPAFLRMPDTAVDWALAAFGGAVLCARLRSSEPGPATWWSGGLRLAVGLLILYQVAGVTPLSLGPSPQNALALPMVLAWIAAFAPAGTVESRYRGFLRIFLPAMAVGEGLSVYPVAGSQTGIAALTFVPVAALCLADGLTVLKAWSSSRGVPDLRRFGAIVGVAAVVVAAQLTLDVVLRRGVDANSAYRHQPSLDLPGAGNLHLPEDQVQMYQSMVAALHKYRCTDFIAYPNINSLYLWSGIEPPPPAAPGVWHIALDSEGQQRIVDELRASKRPCAIRSEDRAALWLGGREVEQRPLVRYIFGEYRPVLTVGEFEFMLPKPGATG